MASIQSRSNIFFIEKDNWHKASLYALANVCDTHLAADPTFLKALLVRSSSLMRVGDLRQALIDIDKHLEIDESSVEAKFIKGCIL